MLAYMEVVCAGHGGLSLVGGEQEKVASMLVMSGGEGYIDFRLGKSVVSSFHNI
jgi:hypothetical protein